MIKWKLDFTFDPGAAHMSITYDFVQNKHICYWSWKLVPCDVALRPKIVEVACWQPPALKCSPVSLVIKKENNMISKNILFRFQRQGTNGISWTQPVSAESFSAHWIARLVLRDTYSSESGDFEGKKHDHYQGIWTGGGTIWSSNSTPPKAGTCTSLSIAFRDCAVLSSFWSVFKQRRALIMIILTLYCPQL